MRCSHRGARQARRSRSAARMARGAVPGIARLHRARACPDRVRRRSGRSCLAVGRERGTPFTVHAGTTSRSRGVLGTRPQRGGRARPADAWPWEDEAWGLNFQLACLDAVDGNPDAAFNCSDGRGVDKARCASGRRRHRSRSLPRTRAGRSCSAEPLPVERVPGGPGLRKRTQHDCRLSARARCWRSRRGEKRAGSTAIGARPRENTAPPPSRQRSETEIGADTSPGPQCFGRGCRARFVLEDLSEQGLCSCRRAGFCRGWRTRSSASGGVPGARGRKRSTFARGPARRRRRYRNAAMTSSSRCPRRWTAARGSWAVRALPPGTAEHLVESLAPVNPTPSSRWAGVPCCATARRPPFVAR
jgi:hypothetical protein